MLRQMFKRLAYCLTSLFNEINNKNADTVHFMLNQKPPIMLLRNRIKHPSRSRRLNGVLRFISYFGIFLGDKKKLKLNPPYIMLSS